MGFLNLENENDLKISIMKLSIFLSFPFKKNTFYLFKLIIHSKNLGVNFFFLKKYIIKSAKTYRG